MTPDGAVIAALAKLAAAFSRRLDGDTIAVYQEALGACDPPTLGIAVRRAIAEEPRFPVPAVLLGYYGVVQHEHNLTQSERRELAEESDVSRKAQERINRRGRRLLREMARLLYGAADIFALLPGDDEPLPDAQVAEIEAQAAAIVAANQQPNRREQEPRAQAVEVK